MDKKEEYEIQYIPEANLEFDKIPGINVPKLEFNISIRGGASGSSAAAKMFAGSQQLVQASLATIVLDTTEIEEGIANDTGAYKMTVAEDGIYRITGQVGWQNGVAGKNYWIYLFKNGSSVSQAVFQANSTSALHCFLNDMLQLVAGDYIQMKVYQDSGSNMYTRAGADDTFLTINKV